MVVRIHDEIIACVKQKVFKHLFGSHEKSFEMLSRLLLAIKSLNSKTIIY